MKYVCAECGEPTRFTDFGQSACCHGDVAIYEFRTEFDGRFDLACGTSRTTAPSARTRL